MGRRAKKKTGTLDRIGEEVNLRKCPECAEHPDCFCWMEGRCTALNEGGGEECPFYKPAERAMEENRRSYRRLKGMGRFDLINEYIKPLTALGLLDEEIEEANAFADELEDFKESDYAEALAGTEDGHGRDDKQNPSGE